MDYSGVNAKAMGMLGSLLTAEDYESLSSLKTVDEVGHRLLDYPSYQRALKPYSGMEYHRGFLEQKMRLSLTLDFSNLYHFMSSHRVKEYFDAFFFRNEISIIKTLMSSIHDKSGLEYTEAELAVLFKDTRGVNLERLLSSDSLTQFVDNLAGSDFHKIISVGSAENLSLFDLEMRLDLYYYMNLLKRSKTALRGRDRKAARYLNGTEIDIRNIMWVYRLKTYYKINTQEIFSYLIPHRYRLTTDSLIKMVNAGSKDELINEIIGCPYGDSFKNHNDGYSIERRYSYVMSRVHSLAQLMYPGSIATALNYVFRKEQELQNITSLLEGIRYNLSRDEIMGFIIKPDDWRIHK